jgi:hypothetical protein
MIPCEEMSRTLNFVCFIIGASPVALNSTTTEKDHMMPIVKTDSAGNEAHVTCDNAATTNPTSSSTITTTTTIPPTEPHTS